MLRRCTCRVVAAWAHADVGPGLAPAPKRAHYDVGPGLGVVGLAAGLDLLDDAGGAFRADAVGGGEVFEVGPVGQGAARPFTAAAAGAGPSSSYRAGLATRGLRSALDRGDDALWFEE